MLKKILILGSNSFSGNHLTGFLLKKNFLVIGCSLSNQSDEKFNALSQLPKKLWNKFKFVKIDINKDFSKLKKLILTNKPDIIIDFLGQGMVAESWEHPHFTFNTNVLSKIKLYNFLITQKFLKKYIKISTPEVFGSAKIKSSDYKKYNPSTPYALSHSTIENYLFLLFKQFSFPVVISRFANFYGPYQKLYRVIPLAIHKADRKEKFFLHGGGTSRRSFIYADDFCEGIYKMMNKAKIGESFQFSSKEYYTIKNIVEMIYLKKNLNPKEYIINVKDRPGKDKDYKIYDKDTREHLKWKNKTSIDNGINKVIEWYDKYKNNFNKIDEKFKIKI
jgi:dTDP-glucose 4,6-dehydratase